MQAQIHDPGGNHPTQLAIESTGSLRRFLPVSDELPPRLELFRRAIKPLLRACLRGHHTLQSIIDLIKMVFVEVAVEELKKSTTKINTSRISVLTGVHRKDVSKIFREGVTKLKQNPPLLFRIVGQWEQDRRFCRKSGQPRVLTWEGEESEFAGLVRSVTDDVRAGTVLFELERSGVVEKTSRGLRLLRVTAPSLGNASERWDFLGRNIESLIEAAIENGLDRQPASNLHTRTEYDRLSVSHLPAIREWVYKAGKAFHRKVRAYLAKHDADIHPHLEKDRKGTDGRVVVITVSFAELPESIKESE